MQSVGCRVWGAGCRVWGVGCRCRVQGVCSLDSGLGGGQVLPYPRSASGATGVPFTGGVFLCYDLVDRPRAMGV